MTKFTCRACGAQIMFIKTANNKSMPVDCDEILVKDGAGMKIVTKDGKVIVNPEHGESGYFPHWATCTDSKRFRNK